jgi:hypothetical protein
LTGFGLADVVFHQVYPDIRACMATPVFEPTHLILSSMATSLVEVPAFLPNAQPFPKINLPLDPSLLGSAALLEVAHEVLAKAH